MLRFAHLFGVKGLLEAAEAAALRSLDAPICAAILAECGTLERPLLEPGCEAFHLRYASLTFGGRSGWARGALLLGRGGVLTSSASSAGSRSSSCQWVRIACVRACVCEVGREATE